MISLKALKSLFRPMSTGLSPMGSGVLLGLGLTCIGLTGIGLTVKGTQQGTLTKSNAFKFQSNSDVTHIIVADDVTEIVSGAFSGATSLRTVDMPKVTKIGKSAFAHCGSLTTIHAPNVTEVGNHAFCSSKKLTTVFMPNATKIGDYAFCGCTLTMLHAPLATIGPRVFKNCGGLPINNYK